VSGTFDRIRPRPERPPPVPPGAVTVDTEGKRALFSTAPPIPAAGSITVECSGCGATSVLSARQAIRALVPSVHLPLLRGRYSSWLRCPACTRRRWVRLRVRL